MSSSSIQLSLPSWKWKDPSSIILISRSSLFLTCRAASQSALDLKVGWTFRAQPAFTHLRVVCIVPALPADVLRSQRLEQPLPPLERAGLGQSLQQPF
jgi:hypothetical protein